MRKTLPFAALVLALAFSTLSAWAQTAPPCCAVMIDDLSDGNPIVTFNGTSTLPVETDLEMVLIDIAGGNFPTAAVELTEPTIDPFGSRISDVVLLLQSPTGGGDLLIFASDGAPHYTDLLAALGTLPSTSVTSMPETGDWQDVSLDLGLPASGIVGVRSDLANVETPEPCGMILLASGLLGLAGFGRRKFRV